MANQSNEPEPSCILDPMWLGLTGQQWHALLETDHGRENLFRKFNNIIRLQNRGHFDELRNYTPQEFLRALIFHGYYPKEGDKSDVLMAGKRKAPAVLDRRACIRITRSTYPNTDVSISELIRVHDDFEKQCERLFSPEGYSCSESKRSMKIREEEASLQHLYWPP